LGYNREFNGEATRPFPPQDPPVPTAPSKQNLHPLSSPREAGRSQPGHEIPALAGIPAPEPSTHKLNSLPHSSSVLLPTGYRGILVLPQQTGAQHENLACPSVVTALGGFPVAVYSCLPSTGDRPRIEIPGAGDDQLGPRASLTPLPWHPSSAAKTAQGKRKGSTKIIT